MQHNYITNWTHSKIPNFAPRPFQQEQFYQGSIDYIREQLMEYKRTEGKKKPLPAFINATVGAGKSLGIAMVSKHISDRGGRALVLSRQSELAEQNADEAWCISCPNSIYSASLKSKSTRYPVVFGTEGTVVNGLGTDFSKAAYYCDVLHVDECLTGDTLIRTRKGLFRIDDKDLINQDIACYDENTGQIKYDKPLRVFSNGINCVTHVRTSNGVIKCTSTHKIYCADSKEWMEAKSLKNGMRLITEDLHSTAMKRLLRASAAVCKKLLSILVKKESQ